MNLTNTLTSKKKPRQNWNAQLNPPGQTWVPGGQRSAWAVRHLLAQRQPHSKSSKHFYQEDKWTNSPD